MNKLIAVLSSVLVFYSLNCQGQDTFSIVAVDSITGEVGSAGASCVDLFAFTGLSNDFLGELFPGVGAINTQAAYIAANQANARNRMNAGDTPSEIINWLVANDVGAAPSSRQYGIVRLVGGSPQSAAYTGADCFDYKNHITGRNYAIQGNILLGQQILDSMEARFNAEPGDLACKLMAALQGANVVGADSRCSSNGTSSLFAFIKVAQPTDTFGNPSFLVSVKTPNLAGIEPIDSLQTLFNQVHNCSIAGISSSNLFSDKITIAPNPFTSQTTISFPAIQKNCSIKIVDVLGRSIKEISFTGKELTIEKGELMEGIYFLLISDEKKILANKRIIIH